MRSKPPPLPPSIVKKTPAPGAPDGAARVRRAALAGSLVLRSPPRHAPRRAAGALSAADVLLDSAIDLAIDSALSGPMPPLPAAPVPPAPLPDRDGEDDSLLQVLLDTVRLQSGRRMEEGGEIGRGGMGAVTEVFDGLLQRPTAKKTLLDQVRGSPVVVRAFIREAQITGQLDHPNIVPVHDLGIDDQGRLFFTMKRVVGRTLDQVLEEDEDNCFIDTTNERLCARMEMMVKVCEALAFAHSRGVLHCDIKAQNVMVGDFGQVYLMDWGFAQLLPSTSERRQVKDILPHLAQPRERFVLGTPGYMSPEQARGEELDERADVFSLGALMHLLLTGRPLYRGATTAEAILKAQRGEFARVQEGTGDKRLFPGELVRIVNRATAKERADRYPGVDALRTDLLQFLRGGSNFPARQVPAGTLILREGDEGGEAYIIVSGECEVYTGSGPSRTVLKSLGPGDVFGEMALLAGAPRIASVVARTDAQLVVVDRQVLEQEVRSMKPWMGAFLRAFAARFRDLQRQADREARSAAVIDLQRSKSAPSAQPEPGDPRWWRLKWW